MPSNKKVLKIIHERSVSFTDMLLFTRHPGDVKIYSDETRAKLRN